MEAESVGFFREILENDLSVLNFIQSDFMTINERLARFYGVPGVSGNHIRKVPVPGGVTRGGVATHASVLTVTSNGTRTSRDEALERFARKKSILDSVQADAKALQGKLGKQDLAKLDEYVTSVRQTELRVERLESWIDVPLPQVDETNLRLDMKSNDGHDRPMWLDVMMEICYLAFVTDSTRVISFEWSREAGGRGGGGENHHELSHHGGDPDMLAGLARIDRFHMERLARFLTFLKETEEEGGSMLDNTLVMFGSGKNSGEGDEHSPKNLPVILAGGRNLGIKHNQHLAHDEKDHPPLSNVLLTIIQKMGVETGEFQDARGTLDGLV